MRNIFATGLLSAVGSLPTHMIPLILASLILGGGITIEQSGWIATSVVLGSLVSTTLLPALKIEQFSRLQLLASALVINAGFLITTVSSFSNLLIGWFTIGMCTGALAYIGTVVAAHHKQPAKGFLIRFGLILVCAGLVIISLQAKDAATSYSELVTFSLFLFPFLIIVCTCIYQPPKAVSRNLVESTKPGLNIFQRGSVLVTFLFFFGVTGVLAYWLSSFITPSPPD